MKYDYVFAVAYVMAALALPLQSYGVAIVSWALFFIAIYLQNKEMDKQIKDSLNRIKELTHEHENPAD